MLSRLPSVSLAVWALVVAPSLCRAEAMTACCALELDAPPDAHTEVCLCPTGECNCEAPTHDDAVCIDACCPVAKPDDGPGGDDPPTVAAILMEQAAPLAGNALGASGITAPSPPPKPTLPIHPSDLPLLI